MSDLEEEIRTKLADPAAPLKPMTLEGCVVRLADTISYIGRDLEDAITLKLLQREELPPEVGEKLGRTNGAIVYSLVADLITHSYDKNYVGYSPEVGGLLKKLKEFNYRRIYDNPRIKAETPKIEALFHQLFERFLADMKEGREDSPIWTDFLAPMEPGYPGVPPAGGNRPGFPGLHDRRLFFAQVPGTFLPAAPAGRIRLRLAMRLMTFNLRFATPQDGPNAWEYRKEMVVEVIGEHPPDLLGTQEGTVSQLHYLEEELTGYRPLAGHRPVDPTCQYPTIFYRADRFEVEESSEFWLSQTPEVHRS